MGTSLEEQSALVAQRIGQLEQLLMVVAERVHDLQSRNVAVDYPEHVAELVDVERLIHATLKSFCEPELFPEGE